MDRELAGSETVRRWMASVDAMYHLSEREWAERLSVLGQWCREVADEPDRVIAGARASREVKNGYMRSLKRFVRERYQGDRAAHDAENVVRSFFIHNGARVIVRPYEEVTPGS
jgi:hypothetical protein